MVWIDVGLNQNGIAALNTVFGEEPYHTRYIPAAGRHGASITFDGKTYNFAMYDLSTFLYHEGQMERLPEDVQQGIIDKLGEVRELETIMGRIRIQRPR